MNKLKTALLIVDGPAYQPGVTLRVVQALSRAHLIKAIEPLNFLRAILTECPRKFSTAACAQV